ncbi:MAG TPA: hypothetical protein VFB96_14450 [Pirellulaceae bacterium]|nr:hypothetical protein [Pirellulaceae bacterium]
MRARERPSRFCRRFFCARLILCGVIAAAGWPNVAAAQQVPDELMQAWRRRQELVKTARFQFTTDVETRHGAGEAFSHRHPDVFVLDGEKWRHETQMFDGGEIVSTFDGHQGMRMFERMQGSILANPVNDDIRYVQLQPIVQWLRPLNPSFHGGVNLSDCELVATDETVNGKPCLKLRAPPEAGGELVLFLFVDPTRGFVVLRLLLELNGRRSTQIDITYAEDPTVGWVPSVWESVRDNEQGALGSRYSSTVAEYAINKPLSEKLFVIDFPPGALVVDGPSNLTYRIGSEGERLLIPPPKPPAKKKPAVPYPSAGELKKNKAWNDQLMRGTLFFVIGALLVLGVAALWRGRRRSA